MNARFLTVLCLAATSGSAAFAQRPGTNYDEAKVGDLPIPDPLVCADGTKVAT